MAKNQSLAQGVINYNFFTLGELFVLGGNTTYFKKHFGALYKTLSDHNVLFLITCTVYTHNDFT